MNLALDPSIAESVADSLLQFVDRYWTDVTKVNAALAKQAP